jgi:hypothetical protein
MRTLRAASSCRFLKATRAPAVAPLRPSWWARLAQSTLRAAERCEGRLVRIEVDRDGAS